MSAMTPTRVRMLIALAAVAGAVGWAVMVVMEGQQGRVIPVPWTAGALLWILAFALFVWTLLARPRLLRRPGARPMSPFVAARSAALAMAASRTGSLVAGFYAGMAVGAFPMRMTPAAQATMWASVLAVSASLALVAVALWLERLCRLPSDDDPATNTRSRVAHPRTEPGSANARIGSPHERPDVT